MQSFSLDRSDKRTRMIGAVCCTMLALAFLMITIYLLLNMVSSVIGGALLSTEPPMIRKLLQAIPLLFLAAGAFWLSGFFFLIMERKITRIRVEEEGVCVMRPLRRDQWLPWSDFQQVCIERVTSRWTGREKPPLLCFIRHDEKQNKYGAWRVDEPWRYRRIIVADYTEALYAAVSACCPETVVDQHGVGAHVAE